MKKLLLIVLILFACEKNINIKSLLKYGDLYYSPISEKPFTGKVFDLYLKNGEMKIVGFYKRGLRTGSWDEFNEDGEKIFSNIYKEGIFIGDTLYKFQANYFTEDYRKISLNTEKDKIVVAVVDYSGKLSLLRTYLDNKIFGYYAYYRDDGIISRDGYYRDERNYSERFYTKPPPLSDKYSAKWKYSEDDYNESCNCYEINNLDGKIYYPNRPEPPSRPSTPIASQEDFGEDIAISDPDFDDFEDWESSPNESDSKSKFIAYNKAPKAIVSISPIYPKAAKNAGFEGTVYVEFFIDIKGSVSEVSILRSTVPSGAGLDEAAVEAVKKSKWKPAQNRDKKVGVWQTVPVKFTLN